MKSGWCVDGHHDQCRSLICTCDCGPHPRTIEPVLPGPRPGLLVFQTDVAAAFDAAMHGRPHSAEIRAKQVAATIDLEWQALNELGEP